MVLTIVYDFFMYISLLYLTTCAAMFLFLICM